MTARPRSLPLARPGLRVVVEPSRRRVPVGGLLLVAAVVVAAFLGLVWSRTALDRAAFDLQEIEHQLQIEEARYWDLRLDAARLHDPGRITTLAEEMGMVYPEQVRTIVVPGVEGSALDTDDRWVDLKTLLSAGP